MDCEIYRCGRHIGTLAIQIDGLYRTLYAELEPCDRILHLYGPENLGVFVPEGKHLIFRRRISKTRLPTLPQWVCAWCEEDGSWHTNRTGYVRYLPTGVETAIPLDWKNPMPFPAAPQALHLITAETMPCLQAFRPYPLNR